DTETPARRLVVNDTGIIGAATLSPDGKRIVYDSSSGKEGRNVVEYSMEGKRIRVLAAEAYAGSWFPQGDSYLYQTAENGRDATLWTRKPDSSAPVSLSAGPFRSGFAHSPDGKRIAYHVAGDRPGLETLSSMGGQAIRVLNTTKPIQGGP